MIKCKDTPKNKKIRGDAHGWPTRLWMRSAEIFRCVHNMYQAAFKPKQHCRANFLIMSGLQPRRQVQECSGGRGEGHFVPGQGTSPPHYWRSAAVVCADVQDVGKTVPGLRCFSGQSRQLHMRAAVTRG